MKKYVTIIEKTKTGYSAYVPDLPGCVATGKSKSLVQKRIYDAILFHIEGMKLSGMKIPDSNTEAESVLIKL